MPKGVYLLIHAIAACTLARIHTQFTMSGLSQGRELQAVHGGAFMDLRGSAWDTDTESDANPLSPIAISDDGSDTGDNLIDDEAVSTNG